MKKMRYIVVVLIIFLCGCFNTVGEWKDFGAKETQIINENGFMYLEIKGGYEGSSYVIKNIEEINNGKSINLIVHLELTTGYSQHKSGMLDYKVKINDELNEVFFGKEKVSIWKRVASEKTNKGDNVDKKK
jgi:hypothetical protein